MTSRDSAAKMAAKVYLSGKTKYTHKDFAGFSDETLNEIIAQSGRNSPHARAAANALAGKKNK